MTKFYTEVFQRGNNIFVRGYENGRRVQKKVQYSPYLFVSTNIDNPTYRTLENNPAEKMIFSSIKEAREHYGHGWGYY